jgi:hypothetical protein
MPVSHITQLRHLGCAFGYRERASIAEAAAMAVHLYHLADDFRFCALLRWDMPRWSTDKLV